MIYWCFIYNYNNLEMGADVGYKTVCKFKVIFLDGTRINEQIQVSNTIESIE